LEEAVRELSARVETLSKLIEELRTHVKDLADRPDPPSEFLDPTGDRLNPWVRESIRLIEAGKARASVDSLEKYRPTLRALREIGRPATAEEVSQKTGRERSTESAYLNNLWLGNIVQKERKTNKKVYFQLRKEEAELLLTG